MPQIDTHTPFLLNLKSGIRHAFAVGLHEVTEEVAAHWYTLAHSHVVEEVKQEAEDLVAEVEVVVEVVVEEVKQEAEELVAEVEAVVETVKAKAKRKPKAKAPEVTE